MDSQKARSIAIHIAQDVIENGRVVGEDEAWIDSLYNEVVFEAEERGFSHEDAQEFARIVSSYPETRIT